jgi:hypothetical protein
VSPSPLPPSLFVVDIGAFSDTIIDCAIPDCQHILEGWGGESIEKVAFIFGGKLGGDWEGREGYNDTERLNNGIGFLAQSSMRL